MATHDYLINNQSASAFRSDLNNVLQAILTQNSSATAPTTTAANMLWYDTANKQIKKRNEADSAWITLGTVNEGAGTFTATGALGFGFDVNNTLSINSGSGVTSTADNDGERPTAGNPYVPSPVGGNMKRITNAGAFTLSAPTASGDYTLVIHITNVTGAGAITLSGFNRSIGSAFTTTVGHAFLVYITKCNNGTSDFELANVVALQ